MKILIKPKFIYFLIPLSFVFVCVVSCVNLVGIKHYKDAIIILVIGWFTGILYVLSADLLNISGTWGALVYWYVITIVFSIYVVKKQQRIIDLSNIPK